MRGGDTERAGYVVGCDGAHSAVRRLLGIDFAGKQYETHILLADVQLTEPPAEAMFARHQRATARCSSCRSATAGSGPSPGTGSATGRR